MAERNRESGAPEAAAVPGRIAKQPNDVALKEKALRGREGKT
jgi:hypothetical protein